MGNTAALPDHIKTKYNFFLALGLEEYEVSFP